MSNFYGTKIEIWDGFGPVDNTEKKIGAYYEQLLRSFFSFFSGAKKIIVRNKKLHKMKHKDEIFSELF